ncbi:prenyltransferase [Archangium lansingense]|uniref:Prenyltransferase n=1 Tax=Archangium lansingense TaxID=2995310 RepID=A0ABT3ZW24_9BACT|nr:prenyltransferase [Archangium lansinium]MCY1073604.1 prenyltransferase [Archangium lansinium]
MSPLARWWYALKPASWPKVLVPALFGQAVGAAAAGHLSLGALVFGVLWMVADVSFVVLLNDWGDREVDALKRRMFPQGCSPKTIPDGILPAGALLAAGLGAGAVALLLAWGAGVVLGRPLLLPLAASGLLVFAVYTLPPLRLNYRGGGELLEMVGVGGVLPTLHAYAQCGQWAPAWWVSLAPGLLALSLSSALASGLSDEESDRAGGKRTFTTVLGNAVVRRSAEVSLFVGVLLWLAASCLAEDAPPLVVVVPAVVLALPFAMRLVGRSPSAVTNAFGAQSAYKGELHRAIWWGTFVLSVLVLVVGLGGWK